MDGDRPGFADGLSLDAYFTAGRDADLIGGQSPEAHIANAQLFCEAIDQDGPVLDLGSGGGLPGLLIARFRPGCAVTLLDASARRCAFLEHWAAELETTTQVLHARAESAARDPAHRRAYQWVTARLFGPPAVAAECAVGFLGLGGTLLVSEPPGVLDHRWPSEGLAELGLVDSGLSSTAAGRIRRLTVVDLVDDFPRPDGRPMKRPLF